MAKHSFCMRGCGSCNEAKNICLECLKIPSIWPLPSRDWVLTEGHCHLPADWWLHHVGSTIVLAIVVLLVSSIVIQCVLIKRRSSTARNGTHTRLVMRAEEAESDDELLLQYGHKTVGTHQHEPVDADDERDRSEKAIAHGLSSWVQRQMMNWEGREPARYSPCQTDVAHTFIMGVGLPLFYGFKALVLASALVTAAALYAVQTTSVVDTTLDSLVEATELGFAGADPAQLLEELPNELFLPYATSMFYCMGGLFIALFGLSVLHFLGQRRFVKHFNETNASMDDFTLHIRGLPASMNDEGRLKALVEQQLGCSGDVVGVSIGYNLSDAAVRGKVFDMFEHRVARADAAFHLMEHELSKHGWGYDARLAKREQLDARADQEEFRKMWDAGQLEGSGHAFVVFATKAAASAAKVKYRGLTVHSLVSFSGKELADKQLQFLYGPEAKSRQFKGRLRDATADGFDEEPRMFIANAREVRVGGHRFLAGSRFYEVHFPQPGQPVMVESHAEIVDDSLEPTSTLWFNFGTPDDVRTKNTWRHVCTFLTAWLIVTLIVYVPLFYFLVTPCSLAKTDPGPVTAQLAGILFAISGNVLGVVNWNSVGSIGHYSKAQQDIHFVIFSTFTNFFNTLLFLGCGLSYDIVAGFNEVDMTDLSNTTVSSILAERALFESYYNTMIPGWLFAGAIVGKVMGVIVPVIQNYLLTRAVFTTQCLPDPLRQLLTAGIPWNPRIDEWLSARQAEHIFEPPEAALAWEYNAYIVSPCICYGVLFVMSPHSWRVFGMLAFWAIFMILLHRFGALMISKKNTTEYFVDTLAVKLWGVVPATVLAAFGFWGVRCNMFGDNAVMSSYWIMAFLFLLGLSLHRLAIEVFAARVKVAMDLRDDSYQETLRRLRYSWFNTNPVHVLKSCYYPEALGKGVEETIAVVPFEFGKEYLQLPEDWRFLDEIGRVKEKAASSMGCYGFTR